MPRWSGCGDSPDILGTVSQPSLDLELEDDPADPTFTVRELADGINAVLQRGFRDGVWVRGEIQGLQERANGHVYFNLTEDGDEGKATLSVVLFGGTYRRLAPMLRRSRLRLENGIAVRIHGRLEFYGPTGRVSLVMDGLDARFTLGQLSAQRDQLLRVLVAEGLLDRNRRVPLPVAPLRVGVVASRDSAAWHDFRAELRRSGFAFRATGGRRAGAGRGRRARRRRRRSSGWGREPVDVIVVIRGGGARTDLATFDTEVIARAIASSPGAGLHGARSRDRPQRRRRGRPHRPEDADGLRRRARSSGWSRTAPRWSVAGRPSSGGPQRSSTAADAGLAGTTRRIAQRTTSAVDLAGQRLDHRAARLRREGDLVLAAAEARLGGAVRRIATAGSRRAPRRPNAGWRS